MPRKQTIHEDPKQQETKWAVFTYCGKEVRHVTMQLRIAFRTKNTNNNI
jgi:hypothetical protein